MDLLLLADESPRMIETYIERGKLFVLSDMGRAIGECLVTDEGGGVLEIKSIAVVPAYQKHGCGRMLIEHIEREFAGEYHTCRSVPVTAAHRPVLRALRLRALARCEGLLHAELRRSHLRGRSAARRHGLFQQADMKKPPVGTTGGFYFERGYRWRPARQSVFTFWSQAAVVRACRSLSFRKSALWREWQAGAGRTRRAGCRM